MARTPRHRPEGPPAPQPFDVVQEHVGALPDRGRVNGMGGISVGGWGEAGLRSCWAHCHTEGGGGRDALEGKGPQWWPQTRPDRRLEEVANAVWGGYPRLQMPLKLALAVGETVAGHGLGALGRGGGGGAVPPSNASLAGGRCMASLFRTPSFALCPVAVVRGFRSRGGADDNSTALRFERRGTASVMSWSSSPFRQQRGVQIRPPAQPLTPRTQTSVVPWR